MRDVAEANASDALQRLNPAVWMVAGFAAGKGLQFALQIVLARLLAPADFGLWAMVLLVTSFTALFKEQVTAQVLVQRGFDDRRLVEGVHGLALAASGVLALAQVALALPVAHFFERPELMAPIAACGAIFLAQAGAGCHDAWLQRHLRFRALALAEVAGALARTLAACLAALAGAGLWAFVVGEVALCAVDAACKRRTSGLVLPWSLRFDRRALAETGRFVGGLTGANLAVQLNTGADNLVVGRLLGAEALGHYSVAYSLAMLPVLALHQINRVQFATLARLPPAERPATLTRALGHYAVIAAPLHILAAFAAPTLVALVYGDAWLPAVPLVQILLALSFARGFMAILGTALNAMHRTLDNAIFNWALVPFALPAYLIGAHLGGVTGVAWAAAIAMALAAVAFAWLLLRSDPYPEKCS